MEGLKQSFLLALIVTFIQNIVTRGLEISDMTSLVYANMNYVGIVLNTANMLDLCIKLFPNMLFEIMFGVYLYRHFCTACVYYFSRQDNRARWFVKECGKLLGYSFAYYVFCALLNIAVGLTVRHIPISELDVRAVFYMVVLPALYTFIFTMWINVLSVMMGGQNAFILMAGMQYLFTFANLLAERDITLRHLGTWKFYLNPVANMVLDWHSDFAYLKDRNMGIPFVSWYSLLYYTVVAMVSILTATMLIRKQDISLENKEEVG